MVSVVQTNWRSIRTASQSGQALGLLLKQYGAELETEARNVVSTVVATVQDESFVGMKRHLHWICVPNPYSSSPGWDATCESSFRPRHQEWVLS